MKLLVLQTLLLSALANMDGGYGANGMKSSDGKDNGRRGNGLALGQVSNGQMQEKKKDGMMYSDGQGRDMRLNGLALGQVSNGERQEEKKDGKNEEMRGNGLALGQVSNSQVQEEKKDGKDKDMGDDRMRMGKANGLNVLIDDEKKKQLGELATPDIVVIKQDWADGKGEVQMNPPAPGGNIITVSFWCSSSRLPRQSLMHFSSQVIVGGGELIYTPDTVVAAVGDKINFVFMARNHTVTQSTFDKPCVKNPMGVDSGFMPNDGAMTPPPSMMFEVKTTAPTCMSPTFAGPPSPDAWCTDWKKGSTVSNAPARTAARAWSSRSTRQPRRQRASSRRWLCSRMARPWSTVRRCRWTWPCP